MHPSRDELLGLVLGTLEEEHAEAIVEHLSDCPRCEETVGELDTQDDDFVRVLRGPATEGGLIEESGCRKFVEVVKRLPAEPSVAAACEAEQAGTSDLEAMGQYQLLAKLGEGGMGAVYQALHTRLDRLVAIKVLPAERMQDAAAVHRFQREMKAVGKLDHPNIVRAMDAGEIRGRHYLVMELVEGIDLSKLARRMGPLDSADACELIRQAAVGLDHAYQRGLVHRDIKPSNLMLAASEDGQPLVKILDMGLALLDEASSAAGQELTTSGQWMGTVEYMAPEQGIDSHLVDIRADIYALGATLYKLLSGDSPFPPHNHSTPLKMMMAKTTGSAVPLDVVCPGLPDGLAELVDRMLANEREDRPASPAEVAASLAHFSAGANLKALLDAASVDRETDPAADRSEQATQQYPVPRSQDTSPSPFSPSAPSSSKPGAEKPEPGTAPAVSVLHARPKRLGVVAAMLAGAAMVAGVLLYLRTPHGTLIVEVNDPTIQVSIDDGAVQITDANDGQPLRVAAGEHQLRVTRGELSFDTDKFTLSRGKEVRLRVELAAGGVRVMQNNAVIGQAELNTSQPAVTSATNFALEVNGNPDKESSVEVGSLTYDGKQTRTVEAIITLLTPPKRTSGAVLIHPANLGLGGDPLELGFFLAPSGKWVGTNNSLPLGRAAHVAAIRDAANDELRVYLDGKLLLKTPAEGSEEVWGHFVLGIPANQRNEIHAVYDEVRVSSVARYTDDFTPPAVDHRFESDEHTLALYHFDEGTGDVLRDSSGHGHHGKIVGARWVKAGEPAIGFPPLDATWLAGLEKLSSDERRAEVVAELRRRNPQAGTIFLRGSSGLTIEASSGDLDLTPLRADPAVRGLLIAGSSPEEPAIVDGEHLSASPVTALEFKYVTVKNLAALSNARLQYVAMADAGIDDVSVFSQLPSLTHLGLDNSKISDLTPLSGVRLSSIQFQNAPVADLSPLRGMPLTDLGCSWTQLTDLTPLRGMKLQKLSCGGLAIKDISPLQGMPLETLHLFHVSLNDLGPLASLEQLQFLDLTDVRTADAEFRHLKKLSKLRNLVLSRATISDAGLASMGKLPALEQLNLGDTGVTDQGLPHLATLTELKVLHLNGTAITDAGLEHLAKLKHLRTLGLAGTKVTARGLAQLASLELESLDLDDVSLDASALMPLKQFKGLKNLTIKNTGLSAEAVSSLRKALPNCTIDDGNTPALGGGSF